MGTKNVIGKITHQVLVDCLVRRIRSDREMNRNSRGREMSIGKEEGSGIGEETIYRKQEKGRADEHQ
jgi:hypothetical protein